MVNVKTYVSWERCGSVVCGPSHQYLIRVSLGYIVRLYTSKLKCKKKKIKACGSGGGSSTHF